MFTTSIGPRIFRYTHVWGMHRRHVGRFHRISYWVTGLVVIELSFWACYLTMVGAILVGYWTLRGIGWIVTRSANRWADRAAERRAQRATRGSI